MIENLIITLRRWVYSETPMQELHIGIEGWGTNYQLKQIFYPNELESNFDIIWRIAGEKLLEAIKKEQTENRE